MNDILIPSPTPSSSSASSSTTQPTPVTPAAKGKEKGTAAKGKGKSKAPTLGAFKCPDCDSTFSRNEYVQRHRRLKHLGSRPFTCPLCTRSFARSDLLKRHRGICSANPLPSATSSEQTILPAEPGQNAVGPGVLGLGGIFPREALREFDKERKEEKGGEGGDREWDWDGSFKWLQDSGGDGVAKSTKGSGAKQANGGGDAEGLVSTVIDQMLNPSAPTPAPADSSPTNAWYPPSYDPPPTANALPSYGAYPSAPSFLNWGREKTEVEELGSRLRDEGNHFSFLFDGTGAEGSGTSPEGSSSSGASFSSISSDGSSPASNAPATGTMPSSATLGTDVLGLSTSTSTPTSQSSSIAPQLTVNAAEVEYAPQAQMMAQYFNKSGVDGITALDLGFGYEPSFYPQELLKDTQTAFNADDKFFMPKDKYALPYMGPLSVPTLPTLSSYASTAATSFLPTVPIMHPGTLDMSQMHMMSGMALAVAGSVINSQGEGVEIGTEKYYQTDEDGEQLSGKNGFGNAMLLEKRVHLIRIFNTLFTEFEDKFAALQSMLLYQLLGLFHKEEQQRKLSRTFHGSMVMMFRDLELTELIREKSEVELNIHQGLEGAELDKVWKQWVEVETWRRVAFTIFLADLETTIFGTIPSQPLLSLSSLSIDLPASDILWNAPDAKTWLAAYHASSTPRPVPFLSAIHALLEEGTPSSWSPKGIILNELPRMSTFPLLVLSRAMCFLEKKKEMEIRDGWSEFEEREGESKRAGKERERELRRIRRGRDRLRGTPGGMGRGGGEGWYEGVKPVVDATEARLKMRGLADKYMKADPVSAAQMSCRADEMGKVW
ncbi:zinc finger, C2H2-type transcription factor [Pseudohyphozyma bogoriensis]|nr:zinc finger, C2H2-type transcription factor [Pseudohyphozyma bogoriensis]